MKNTCRFLQCVKIHLSRVRLDAFVAGLGQKRRAVGAEININNVYVREFRESEALMQQQQFCELVFLLAEPLSW